MITPAGNLRVFLVAEPVDFRKGMDGLAGVVASAFGLVGSQRGWGNSAPGRLINTILQHRVGNPVVVVDEVEKAGLATSTKGQAFSLAESLLPLLEPISAKA